VEAASKFSGTLTVSDGVHMAKLLLLGTYMASQFTSASDGGGGTLIGDPPAMAPQTITVADPPIGLLVQAMASFGVNEFRRCLHVIAQLVDRESSTARADLAAFSRPRLTTASRSQFAPDMQKERKAQMVGIARLPGTDQAALPGDKAEMGLVAVAAQLGKGQHALVNSGRFGLRRGFLDLRRKGSLVGGGRRFGYVSVGCP